MSDGNKKRKRPADKDKLPPPPKHAAAFDLDPSDWVFSSTQQLNEEHGHVGTETQAVADILAVDLPADEGEEAAEDGGAEEDAADADPNEGGSDEDDLDTPLGVRFARQSGGKGSFGKGSRARARATGRSRLAQASGPGAAANVQGAEEESRGGDPARKAGTRAGVAQRFSVRHLQSHPERPVKLHKGTPLPGAMPHSVQAQKK